MVKKKYNEILDSYKEIKNIEYSLSLMNWDQSVNMPLGGGSSRADIMGTLSKIAHEKFLDSSFSDKIDNLIADKDFNSLSENKRREILKIGKEAKRAKKIPVSYAEDLTRTTAKAMSIWEEAKRKSDDSLFLPILKKVFDLKKKYSDLVGYEVDPYDALLDDYDEGLTYSYIRPIFENLEIDICDILQNIDLSTPTLPEIKFDKTRQKEFGLAILKDMGLDFKNMREDISFHPFTTRVGINDVRITTDIVEEDLFKGLFSTIHEGGHCLYELECCKIFGDSPLGILNSLSLHESQSRFYENIIGRSYEFWSYYFPKLKELFPEELKGINLDYFYKSLNKVEKTQIRIESDEVTYNLHILLRTEIEREIINGAFDVNKIEEFWNEKTKKFFGFYPSSKSSGYLQDIHWSDGLFGYFPTYTFGNIISAQFYSKMLSEISQTSFEKEDRFDAILKWFRKNLYSKGSIYSSSETVKLISGEKVNPKYFSEYLKNKFLI